MPSSSKAQRRLMAIAEHNPDELYPENKDVADMGKKSLHDLAATKEKGLPEHKKHEKHGRGSHSDAHLLLHQEGGKKFIIESRPQAALAAGVTLVAILLKNHVPSIDLWIR